MLATTNIFVAALELSIAVLTLTALMLYVSHRRPISLQKMGAGFRIILLGLSLFTLYSLVNLYAWLAFPNYLNNKFGWYIHDLRLRDWFAYLPLLSGLLSAVGMFILLRGYSLRAKKHARSFYGKDIEGRIEQLTADLSESNEKIADIVSDPILLHMAYLLSEKNFYTLFYDAPGIFLSLNRDKTIRDINHYAAKRLNTSSGNLIGNALKEFVSTGALKEFETFVDNCFKTENNNLSCEIKLTIGTRPIWVHMFGKVMCCAEEQEYLLLICQDVSESKKLKKEISAHATHDSLTELHNRHALEAYLNEIFTEQSLFTKPAALIYFDVDQFKIINDTCGHLAGDELLKQLVKVIKARCQSIDFFARIGGDEFAIVQKDVDTEKARELAETIRSITEDLTFSWDDHNFRQSVSLGVALTSPRVCTLTDIFGAADAACSQAKEAGRNRVVLHTESRDAGQDSRNDMLWVSRIQNAFTSDRLILYFQPIADIKDPLNGYIHYELLLRYVGDDGRHISPDRFLPAAEKYGISNQIDLWVLTTALDFLQRNPQHTRDLQCCSINLSANSLGNFQIRSAIKVLMENLDFPTNKICFEITESSAIQSLNDAIEFIGEMKILGCKFALDDFGTGFSSLGYLKALDVDYLKIDGAFVRDIVNDSIDRAMVTAIANISKEMNIKTIAEYVEDEQVLNTLIPLNVDYGQGYGIARPMNLDQAVEYYKYGNSKPTPKL